MIYTKSKYVLDLWSFQLKAAQRHKTIKFHADYFFWGGGNDLLIQKEVLPVALSAHQMASLTSPLGSPASGAACWSIAPHIKAYQKSNVWERRIPEQILYRTARAPAHASSKKVLDVHRNPVTPLLESTYLTGHREAEPALQLSVQQGTDAPSPSRLSLPGVILDLCFLSLLFAGAAGQQ